MAINSRDKGASGEREFASEVYKRLGVKIVRKLDQTRGGGYDLMVDDDEDFGDLQNHLRRLAIECKRHREASQAKIATWWAQTLKQSGEKRMPVLAYREDRQDWRVVIPLHYINPSLQRSTDLSNAATVTLDGFISAVRHAVENPSDVA